MISKCFCSVLVHSENTYFICTIITKLKVMDVKEISFENLPRAIAFLINEIAEIKSLVQQEQPISAPIKRIPIGVEAVCAIINKAKPTVYALVRKRMIPCYKNGRKLYFFEDEIVAWISKGKQKTLQEIAFDAETHFKKFPLKKQQ